MAQDEAWDLGLVWGGLARRLVQLGRLTGDVEALREAVGSARQSVDATSPTAPAYPGRLGNLGAVLATLYSETAELPLLEEAAEISARLVQVSDDHPDLPMRLANHAWNLRDLAVHRGDDTLRMAAALHARRAVASTARSDPAFAVRLQNLAILLADPPGAVDRVAWLDEAVRAAVTAVSLTPHESLLRGDRLRTLAGALAATFRTTPSRDLRQDVIRVAKDAVKASPPGSLGRARALLDLSHYLSELGRDGDPEPLDQALALAREAARLATSSPDRRWQTYQSLSNRLLAAAVALGNAALLDEAASVARAAVGLVPAGHPARPKLLSGLGYALSELYHRAGRADVLEEAVAACRAAADLVTPDDRRYPSTLNALAVVVSDLARHRDPSLLEESAVYARRAVALTEDADGPLLASRLNTLGNQLWLQVTHNSAPDTLLDESLTALRRCVTLTPEDHKDRPQRLADLAVVLSGAGERSSSPALLAESVAHAEECVRLTPSRSLDRPGRLHNLYLHLQAAEAADPSADLADRLGEVADELCEELAEGPVASTFVRTFGGPFLLRSWTARYTQLRRSDDPSRARDWLDRADRLAGWLAEDPVRWGGLPSDLDPDDQHAHLLWLRRGFDGVAGLSAWLHLTAGGDAENALLRLDAQLAAGAFAFSDHLILERERQESPELARMMDRLRTLDATLAGRHASVAHVEGSRNDPAPPVLEIGLDEFVSERATLTARLAARSTARRARTARLEDLRALARGLGGPVVWLARTSIGATGDDDLPTIAFAMAPDGRVRHTLLASLPQSRLVDLATRFMGVWTDTDGPTRSERLRVPSAVGIDTPTAAETYHGLVEELVETSRGLSDLGDPGDFALVVVDAAAAGLPWHEVLTGDPPVVRAGALACMPARPSDRHGVAVLANPAADLPGAGEEGRALRLGMGATLWDASGGSTTLPWDSRPRIWHVAAHGLAPPPLILLDEADTNEDGHLVVRRDRSLPYDALPGVGGFFDGLFLWFLNACFSSAADTETAADEAAGFATLAAVLGTRHVVTTRWRIADGAAKKFALSFYRHLAEFDDPVAALRAARREVAREDPVTAGAYSITAVVPRAPDDQAPTEGAGVGLEATDQAGHHDAA